MSGMPKLEIQILKGRLESRPHPQTRMSALQTSDLAAS